MAYVYMYIYTYAYIYRYMCIYIRVHIYMHVCICVSVYIYINIYVCILLFVDEVRQGFFEDASFYRAVPKFLVQFGVLGKDLRGYVDGSPPLQQLYVYLYVYGYVYISSPDLTQFLGF